MPITLTWRCGSPKVVCLQHTHTARMAKQEEWKVDTIEYRNSDYTQTRHKSTALHNCIDSFKYIQIHMLACVYIHTCMGSFTQINQACYTHPRLNMLATVQAPPPPPAAWQSPAVPNFILEQSLTRSSFTLPILIMLSISDRVSSPCKAVQRDEQYNYITNKQTLDLYGNTAYVVIRVHEHEWGRDYRFLKATRERDKPCPVASILQSSSLVQRPSPRRGWPSQYAPSQSSEGT